MRISDWSSDVCSSDLKARTIMRDMRVLADVPVGELAVERDLHCPGPGGEIRLRLFAAREMRAPGPAEIGRASCRERVCKDVEILVVAVPLQKKMKESEIGHSRDIHNK